MTTATTLPQTSAQATLQTSPQRPDTQRPDARRPPRQPPARATWQQVDPSPGSRSRLVTHLMQVGPFWLRVMENHPTLGRGGTIVFAFPPLVEATICQARDVDGAKREAQRAARRALLKLASLVAERRGRRGRAAPHGRALPLRNGRGRVAP